ncbi:MAG: hypothetical protein U9R07_14875 [Pseudomonadota bacterium]|nr:hypothetical protein [Pseudomonadota bacterium]
MSPSLEQLRGSPDHYLHSLEGDEALFVPMDLAAYQRSIFLDQRISPAGEGGLWVPLASLGPADGNPPQLGWIFHVAHCGSTLLARALDELSGGANLVLREPLALRQLSAARDSERLRLVLALLAKRYPGGGATLIKANVPVNFLLDEIAASDPAAPAILLKLDLPDYLLAILRSDQHRAWLRTIVAQFAQELGLTGPLSDADAGAALWLGQMRRFAAAAAAMPNARVLDAEQFYGNPAGTLQAAASLLGMPANAPAIDTVVSGPLFTTYSKRPGLAFDNAARLERRDQLAQTLAGELAEAQDWLAGQAPDAAAMLGALAKAALV